MIGLKNSPASFLTNQMQNQNHDLDMVTRVFPRLAPVTCICFEFSLVHFVFVWINVYHFGDQKGTREEKRFSTNVIYIVVVVVVENSDSCELISFLPSKKHVPKNDFYFVKMKFFLNLDINQSHSFSPTPTSVLTFELQRSLSCFYHNILSYPAELYFRNSIILVKLLVFVTFSREILCDALVARHESVYKEMNV